MTPIFLKTSHLQPATDETNHSQQLIQGGTAGWLQEQEISDTANLNLSYTVNKSDTLK